MKRKLLILCLLALLIPSALLAQGEITLEGLAEQVAAIVNRVEALENLFANPWSPEIVYTDDGICQNPLHRSSRYGGILELIHQETADAYRVAYGVSIAPHDVDLHSFSFATHTNHVYIEYGKGDKRVLEKWAHCQFLGHSEWAEAE